MAIFNCYVSSPEGIWGCEVVGEPLQPPGTEVFDACPATSSSLYSQSFCQSCRSFVDAQGADNTWLRWEVLHLQIIPFSSELEETTGPIRHHLNKRLQA